MRAGLLCATRPERGWLLPLALCSIPRHENLAICIHIDAGGGVLEPAVQAYGRALERTLLLLGVEGSVQVDGSPFPYCYGDMVEELRTMFDCEMFCMWDDDDLQPVGRLYQARRALEIGSYAHTYPDGYMVRLPDLATRRVEHRWGGTLTFGRRLADSIEWEKMPRVGYDKVILDMAEQEHRLSIAQYGFRPVAFCHDMNIATFWSTATFGTVASQSDWRGLLTPHQSSVVNEVATQARMRGVVSPGGTP